MDKMSLKAAGHRLSLLREYKGFENQREMATYLKISTNRYNNWELGVNGIPVEYAIKISILTGASLDYIYRGEMASLPLNLVTFLSEKSTAAKLG